MNPKQRRFNDLLRELKGASKKLLHPALRSLKESEAHSLGAGDQKTQLAYLFDRLGEEAVRAAIKKVATDKEELQALAREFGQKGMLIDLFRLVAFYKQAESDSLGLEGPEAQLRYLLIQLGGRDRLEQCLKDRRARDSE